MTTVDGLEVLVKSDASRFTQYITSYYFALTTLTTVGYGDISPQTNVERVFIIIVMLVGAIIYASIFGNMAALIQSFDSAAGRYREKMDRFRDFADFYGLTDTAYNKIILYADKLYYQTGGFNTTVRIPLELSSTSVLRPTCKPILVP